MATSNDTTTQPLDVDAMRAAARRVLAADADPPSPDEITALTQQLREHITLAIPAVAAAASRLPKDDVPRACANACLLEAGYKLRLGDGGTPAVRLAVAQKLARVAGALADHYENLGSH